MSIEWILTLTLDVAQRSQARYNVSRTLKRYILHRFAQIALRGPFLDPNPNPNPNPNCTDSPSWTLTLTLTLILIAQIALLGPFLDPKTDLGVESKPDANPNLASNQY